MGSPRKGNTYRALQKLEAAMQEMGEVEFETLWLKDVNYKTCLGCHVCIMAGEEKCPLKDDMASIEQKMHAADGIILATPVYSLQVSFLMKEYIDRFSYMWHRPRFFGKCAMGLATGGGQFKETLGYIKTTTQSWGYNHVAEVGVPQIDALVPEMRKNVDRDVRKAAAKFFMAVQKNQMPAPSLMDLVRFRIWRLNALCAKETLKRDFEHWTENGWFEQDYYVPVRVNPLKKILADLIEKQARRFLRNIYVGY